MSQLRVLHTNFLHGWGGQSNRILTECEGLAARGWDVLVSAPPDSQLLKRAQARGLAVTGAVRYVGGLKAGFLADILAMRRLLREFRPDLVHLHGGKDSWVLAEALAVRRPAPRPVIVRTKHNVFPVRDHLLNRWQYGRFFDQIIGLSTAIVEQLREKPYIDPAKLVLIPSAIDAERFHVAPDTRERLRKEFGFEAHHLVVGMTGRLRPEKGHDILLEAVPDVVREVPDARFLLIGSGSLGGELRERLDRSGFASHVHMAGFRTDVPDCLAALDAYVQPSRSEGLGTSILEASAAGLPIVASRTGGIPDVIIDGETGLLADPESPPALARALIRLLKDPSLRQTLAAAARRRVQTVFSIGPLVENTEKAYHSVLATHRKGDVARP